MITLENVFVPVGGSVDEPVMFMKGKSTDDKPTETFMGKNIGNGSGFFEIDTQNIKFYDADTDSWV